MHLFSQIKDLFMIIRASWMDLQTNTFSLAWIYLYIYKLLIILVMTTLQWIRYDNYLVY